MLILWKVSIAFILEYASSVVIQLCLVYLHTLVPNDFSWINAVEARNN